MNTRSIQIESGNVAMKRERGVVRMGQIDCVIKWRKEDRIRVHEGSL